MLELSASFRLPTYGLLPLALLVGFIPTRYLLATALNVNLTSTLDEDDALHAESALFNYAVALFLCALFSFVWPGSACALHREVVDEATPSAVHLHKPRAACPASTQATAPCTGRLAWSAEGDGCAASAKCTEPAAPHRTGSLSVSLPPDEDPAASSLASCTSLPATAAATESVEAPAAATVAAADAAVPLPSELNAWPPNSLGSPGVLAQLLALEQGGCECETLEPVGCECATVQGSRASGPANALDWADPELQVLSCSLGVSLFSACDGDGAPGSALYGAPRGDGARDGAPQPGAATHPPAPWRQTLNSAAKVRGAHLAAALGGLEARATYGRSRVNVTQSNTGLARRCEKWASRREALLRRERGVQAAMELEDCTFTPKLNAHSLWIDADRASSTGRQRIEDLHRTATRAGWRHPRDEYAGAEEEELREAEGLRQCSSKPHLDELSEGGYPEEDIARRCEKWATRREALLRRERGVQAAKELEDCTFTPNVDLPDSSTRAAQVVHVLATTAWGAVAIDEHLTRQIGVRATRDQRDPRVKFADGSWLGGHRANYQA